MAGSAKGDLPDANDPSRRDPTFGDVAIPKYYWKVIVIERAGELVASTFLLSQQDQILDIDRIHESTIRRSSPRHRPKVFQISIADLAKFTRLNYGKLTQVDTKEAVGFKPRLIESLEEIRI